MDTCHVCISDGYLPCISLSQCRCITALGTGHSLFVCTSRTSPIEITNLHVQKMQYVNSLHSSLLVCYCLTLSLQCLFHNSMLTAHCKHSICIYSMMLCIRNLNNFYKNIPVLFQKFKIIPHRKKYLYIYLGLLLNMTCASMWWGHFRNCQLSDDGGPVLSTVFADKMQCAFEKRSECKENSCRVRLFQKSAQLVCF